MLLAVLVAACSAPAEPRADGGPRDAGRAMPPEVGELDAMGMPLDRLRSIEDAWAARTGPNEAGVRAARRAASLARIRALREPEGDGLARARALLAEASLRRDVAGACDAAIDLARLEARDAVDPTAAYLVAHRASRRWTDDACALEARRILGALEGHRPDRALLAAIDADPNADDPSIGLAGDTETPPRDALEAWAAERTIAGEPATLESIVVYGHEDREARSVRVVLALDRVAAYERLDLPAEGELPARVAIDLASTTPASSLPSTIPVGAAGLARIRHARRDDRTRIVLDLEPGTSARVFLLPQPFRVVIDVTRGDATTTGAARDVDLILIDPGHGGDDYGARAFGMREADIVLDLAMRVRDVLRRRLPNVRVVLTRDRDVFVSLEQRAAMANAVSADAFVSIHLNAADESVDHGGVTTFVLDTTNDRQALRLAARENGTTTAEVGGLARIIAGLRREEQVATSRALAERIHRGTLAGGRTVLPRLHDRGVRSAMFYVLVGATMPAVLVEASFMTREDEADALRNDRYRGALADGIAEGIVRWVEGR
ncbi:N-acetylmuramoyl-L-alanine amidase [Sandaracinus amylolyticus]|nr:N-acetylmuramoyl-L-alanine amidase [Sandaracinus amylolyticus]